MEESKQTNKIGERAKSAWKNTTGKTQNKKEKCNKKYCDITWFKLERKQQMKKDLM